MTSKARVLSVSVLAILTFDVVASVASRAFELPYGAFSIGSFLVYGAVGFWAARVSSVSFALVTGAVTGFAESTLGWAISWIIGPGRPETSSQVAEVAIGTIGLTVVTVTIAGAAIGFVGGVFGKFGRRKVPDAA